MCMHACTTILACTSMHVYIANAYMCIYIYIMLKDVCVFYVYVMLCVCVCKKYQLYACVCVYKIAIQLCVCVCSEYGCMLTSAPGPAERTASANACDSQA